MDRIWIAKAPPGEWTSGPRVIRNPTSVQDWADLNYVLEGPYVRVTDVVDFLDNEAQLHERFYDTFVNPHREAPRMGGRIDALRETARNIEETNG